MQWPLKTAADLELPDSFNFNKQRPTTNEHTQKFAR